LLGGYRGLGVGAGAGAGDRLGFGSQIGQVNMSKGHILSHIRDRKL
jgi:hypothetical protein